MKYQAKCSRDELLDALVSCIDDAVRDGKCATVDEWQIAIERTLSVNELESPVIDVPATDPAGYIGRGAESRPLTPAEAAHIEFSAGRTVAALGHTLLDTASDAARNGYAYEQALIAAQNAKPGDAPVVVDTAASCPQDTPA